MSENVQDKLAQLVKFRLASVNKAHKAELDGTFTAIEIEIFTPEKIETALSLALTAFNAVPPLTYFQFQDEENIMQLSDLLVTYAGYLLLTQQSLVEKGREFDSSVVGYTSTNMSNFLYDVGRDMYHDWIDRVQKLKESSSFYADFIREPSEE